MGGWDAAKAKLATIFEKPTLNPDFVGVPGQGEFSRFGIRAMEPMNANDAEVLSRESQKLLAVNRARLEQDGLPNNYLEVLCAPSGGVVEAWQAPGRQTIVERIEVGGLGETFRHVTRELLWYDDGKGRSVGDVPATTVVIKKGGNELLWGVQIPEVEGFSADFVVYKPMEATRLDVLLGAESAVDKKRLNKAEKQIFWQIIQPACNDSGVDIGAYRNKRVRVDNGTARVVSGNSILTCNGDGIVLDDEIINRRINFRLPEKEGRLFTDEIDVTINEGKMALDREPDSEQLWPEGKVVEFMDQWESVFMDRYKNLVKNGDMGGCPDEAVKQIFFEWNSKDDREVWGTTKGSVQKTGKTFVAGGEKWKCEMLFSENLLRAEAQLTDEKGKVWKTSIPLTITMFNPAMKLVEVSAQVEA